MRGSTIHPVLERTTLFKDRRLSFYSLESRVSCIALVVSDIERFVPGAIFEELLYRKPMLESLGIVEGNIARLTFCDHHLELLPSRELPGI